MTQLATSPADERERDDGDQRPPLVGQDLLQPAERAAHARLAGAAVDLPVHLRERRLEPAPELALRRAGTPPRAGPASSSAKTLSDTATIWR